MLKAKKRKIILITGCSSGFGLLAAARLASRGHHVIATMRDLKRKAALLSEIDLRGGEARIIQMDVTDQSSVREAIKEVGALYGRLDVIVNNAGFGLGGFFEDLTDAEIREQLETNFFGVLNVCRAGIPLMRPQRKGKIINISSMSAFSSSPCFGAYNASKWALDGFSESLFYELKLFGINVYLIQPGAYKTKIFYENARYASKFDDEKSPYYEFSRFLRKRVQAHMEDNYKDPEEVAQLIEKIIMGKRTSFRSIPDLETKIIFLLRKFLPFCLYRRLIEQEVFKGLNGPGKS